MVELESITGYPEKVEDRYSEGSHYVYVLRLFDNRWYIGETEAPKRRVISHARGDHTAPDFVKQYPPVGIGSVLEYDSRDRAKKRETAIAEAFAHFYGSSRVRGGGL